MKNDRDKIQELVTLRQRAEAKLRKDNSVFILSDNQLSRLVHELEVHQVELEMQNEELALAKGETDTATQKYTELYDFLPSGYLTINKEGEIIELNRAGAELLGKNRFKLVNSRFGFFVSDAIKPIFDAVIRA